MIPESVWEFFFLAGFSLRYKHSGATCEFFCHRIVENRKIRK